MINAFHIPFTWNDFVFIFASTIPNKHILSYTLFHNQKTVTMKKLKVQILLLLLSLIGAQTLNAQQIIKLNNSSFSMTVTYVSSNANEECYEITVKPKNLDSNEKVVITDSNRNRRFECSSDSCTFTWCFDKVLGMFSSVELDCFVEDERGFRLFGDTCTIIIEPGG